MGIWLTIAMYSSDTLSNTFNKFSPRRPCHACGFSSCPTVCRGHIRARLPCPLGHGLICTWAYNTTDKYHRTSPVSLKSCRGCKRALFILQRKCLWTWCMKEIAIRTILWGGKQGCDWKTQLGFGSVIIHNQASHPSGASGEIRRHFKVSARHSSLPQTVVQVVIQWYLNGEFIFLVDVTYASHGIGCCLHYAGTIWTAVLFLCTA